MTKTNPDANGWYTMESAPKDGTRILAVWGRHGVQIIAWHSWRSRPEYFVKPGACWKPENGHVPINVTPNAWQHLPPIENSQ